VQFITPQSPSTPVSEPGSPKSGFGALLQNADVPREPAATTLLKLLTLPFLAVVVALAALVGWLSYRSANAAVDEAAQQWLGTALQRVGDDVVRQQVQADTVLQAALPDGTRLPDDLSGELDWLGQRLGTAAQFHPQERGRITLVSLRGQAVDLQRLGKGESLLSFQRAPGEANTRLFVRGTQVTAAANTAHAFSNTSPSSGASVETTPPQDPREQAWVQQALRSAKPGWSPLVLEGGSASPTWLRIRPLKDAEQQTMGAIATPLSLQLVQDTLGALKLPPQGVAFVVERNGQLVASSAGPVVRRAADGTMQRLHVSQVDSDLMRAAYDRSLPHMGSHSVAMPGRMTLNEPGLPSLVSSFGRLADDGGQDWALIVAAPRSAFTADLLNTVIRSVAATLAAIALVLLIAAWIRRRLARDVLALSHSLQAVADGDLDTPPPPMRSAELQSLREAVRRIQMRLRRDRLLGLANREAVLSRLHDRMRPGRRHNDSPILALMVVDLDRFREVNRQHGHEAGDFVLQTIGKRLRQTVRDTDLVARWAGDQFVLLLDGMASPEDAHRVRDQVERVLRDPVELGPGREAVELAGTAGLAISRAESSTPDDFLRSAEIDMETRKPTARPGEEPSQR
jgi:diguanylate cyclase (GGDEF)-like protein